LPIYICDIIDKQFKEKAEGARALFAEAVKIQYFKGDMCDPGKPLCFTRTAATNFSSIKRDQLKG